jgi:hypothetical protein
MADYKYEEKEKYDGTKVKVLSDTFEPGPTEVKKEKIAWRGRLADRSWKMKYLQSAERYWFSNSWYGSEKRKNPA